MRNPVCIFLLIAATHSFAQPTRNEDLGDERPETWAMQYYTSLGLPLGFGPAEKLAPWKTSLSIEVDHLPWLSEEERRVGFDGTKVEDLNHAPALLRPGLNVGLPGDLSASFFYVPPVRAFDLKTELYGISVQKSFGGEGPWRVGIRGFGQYSRVRGAFTCTQEAADGGSDFERNPFGCDEASHDTVRMRAVGIEASLAYTFNRFGGLTPFATVSWQNMNMDFDVDALRGGSPDQRTLSAETQSWVYTGGARLSVSARLTLAASVLHAPINVLRPGQTSPRNESVTALRTQLTYYFGPRS